MKIEDDEEEGGTVMAAEAKTGGDMEVKIKVLL